MTQQMKILKPRVNEQTHCHYVSSAMCVLLPEKYTFITVDSVYI